MTEDSNAAIVKLLIEKMGPTFIVMVTIGVGVFYFMQEINDTRVEEQSTANTRLDAQEKRAQERLDNAQKLFVSSQEKFGPFISSVIENVQDAVTLQKALSDDMLKAQESLLKTQESLAAAIKQKDEAIHERATAEQERAEATNKLKQRESEAAKLFRELKEEQTLLAESRRKLDEKKDELEKKAELLENARKARSDQVANLRMDLLGLARAIRDGENETSLTRLAQDILDRDTSEPLEALQKLANTRSSSAGDDMPSFIGRSIDSLKAVAKEDSNFETWIALQEEEKTVAVFVVGKIKPDHITDGLSIAISEGRVTDTSYDVRIVYLAQIPNPKNWLRDIYVIVSQDGDGDWDIEIIEDIEDFEDIANLVTPENKWRIQDLLSTGHDSVTEIWNGTANPITMLDVKGLQKALSSTNAARGESELGVLFTLIRSSESFKPENIPVNGSVSAEFGSLIRQMAETAKRRELTSEIRSLGASYLTEADFGELAVLVLYPRFRLTDMVPTEDEITPKVLTVYVQARYFQPDLREEAAVWLRFERAAGEKQWLFAGFANDEEIASISGTSP